MTFTQARSWWILLSLLAFIAFIYYLSPILTPFLLAFVLAYLTDPIVKRLVKLKIPRTLAVTIVFIGLFAIIILLAILLIPLLEKQIWILINKIPQILVWAQQQAFPWLETHFGIKEAFNIQAVKGFITENWEQASNVVTQVWKTVFYSGYSIFLFLFNLVMIPVVTFYLLKDWERIIKETRKLFPRSLEPLWVRLIGQCDEVLGAFFRGQLLVMLALGIYYSAALWLMGLELALLIGLVIGIISIVPYLGFIVGVILAAIATLVQFQDAIHLIYVVVIFTIGSLLENTILSPLLVGDRIGLHPVAVIFAVLAGGQLFGFTGVLLALPVAAVTMVLIRYGRQRYLESRIYQVKEISQ